MSDLLQSVGDSISDADIHALAGQINAKPEQVNAAIQAALPALVGSLARTSSEPQGAQRINAFVDTVGTKHSGSAPLQFADGGSGMSITDILGQLVGARQGRVEQGVSKASGLNGAQTTQLLAALLPIVLAFLAKRRQQTPADRHDSDLSDYLGQQRKQTEQSGMGSLLGRLLDQDGDGDFDFADILKFGFSRFGRSS